LQHPLLPNDSLAEFYRFALLLTGNADVAAKVLAETLQEVESQLAELRHENSRLFRLASGIRQRCLRDNTCNTLAVPRLLRGDEFEGGRRPLLEIEGFILAQRFSTLPEPERSALALFYVDLFTNEEIAKLLKMTEDDLSYLVTRGRGFLDQALHPAA
jgi:DNA-directed RNA polymerase specialized sigma24 family protein